MTAERMARSDRSTGTREAILSAAEWLFAERGMYAVSNRQISEAAGQATNAAACLTSGQGPTCSASASTASRSSSYARRC